MNPKVPAVVIVSHGYFCSEALNTVQMIYGPTENLVAVPLEVGQSPESYEQKLEQIVDSFEGNVLLLSDLTGGTPFKTVMQLGKKWPVAAVAGVNIPMIIEAIDLRNEQNNLDELAAAITQSAKDSITDVTSRIRAYYEKYHVSHQE